MTMDLKHHHVEQLTTDHTSHDPTTNGTVVAWLSTSAAQSQFCVCSAIMMENLKSQMRTMISPNAIGVRLSGPLLTWLSTSSSTKVQGIDLSYHRHFTLAWGGSMASGRYFHALGWGSGRRQIWEKDVGFNTGPVPPDAGVPNPSSGTTFVQIRDVPPRV
jgi:hypothetical protein